jgi:ketosteroid isomerase-like protein
MSTDTLQGAHEEFCRALNCIFTGDSDTMAALWSHQDDITYMSPFGDLLTGWEPIGASWTSQAAVITGGPVAVEENKFFESPSLGVVVFFLRGSVTVDGEAQEVNNRATSTFRLEDGQWKMIGHHADRF